MRKFQGTGCSEGLACGAVLIKKSSKPEISAGRVEDVEAQLALLRESIDTLDARLEQLYDKTMSESGEEAAELIESYQMILMDRPFFSDVEERISAAHMSAPAAIRDKCKVCAEEFSAMDDEYMRERYSDIEAVCEELVAILCHSSGSLFGAELSCPTVVVADMLTPMDTVRLNKDLLMGFVTENGGTTSHAVILARTLGIPAVVGVEGITGLVETGEEICINGCTGAVIASPTQAEQESFSAEMERSREASERYLKEPFGAVKTIDGTRIMLAVNSGDSDTAGKLDADMCDGVGLFRTEFLYMNTNRYPTENELFEAYAAAAGRLEGKPFIFRTLDIGGDKALDYMDLGKEDNPFLGYRAVRICLDRPELFKTQLRALLRASVFGNIQIMFPMITCLDELLRCREALKECMDELRQEGLPFSDNIPVGIMVETPASVLILDRLAPYSDFFSVGTNDLIQYTMAADRGNSRVSGLYDPFQIAVLRSLRRIGQVANEYKVPLGVCGEAAAFPAMVPFLIGCGVEELSVASSALPKLRYLVRRLEVSQCRCKAEEALEKVTAAEARAVMQAYADSVLERR